MKAIKKAQNGAKTADSTSYYSNKAAYLTDRGVKQSKIKDWDGMNRDFDDARKSIDDMIRQSKKGKAGYDKNGYPIKKEKAKSGATIAKDGKWMQKATASIKRRGTEGKCTPITKPGCTGRAKALAKTFKKIAKSNKKK